MGVEWIPGCIELLKPPVDCERVVRGWPLATGDDADEVGESPNPELAIDWRCWLNDMERCDGWLLFEELGINLFIDWPSFYNPRFSILIIFTKERHTLLRNSDDVLKDFNWFCCSLCCSNWCCFKAWLSWCCCNKLAKTSSCWEPIWFPLFPLELKPENKSDMDKESTHRSQWARFPT